MKFRLFLVFFASLFAVVFLVALSFYKVFYYDEKKINLPSKPVLNLENPAKKDENKTKPLVQNASPPKPDLNNEIPKPADPKIETKQNLDENLNKNSKIQSPKEEYQTRGKSAVFEKKLSTKNINVYVLDGKRLSDYKINLLNKALEKLKKAAPPHKLTLFVQILPNNELGLALYNKDLIFAKDKSKFKYIKLEQIMPDLEKNSAFTRGKNEILERIGILREQDEKTFASHVNGLKSGLDASVELFEFCEVIRISSVYR